MSRHKCTSCGKVREEKFMNPTLLHYVDNKPVQATTRWGHGIWYCKDNDDCLDDRFRGRY